MEITPLATVLAMVGALACGVGPAAGQGGGAVEAVTTARYDLKLGFTVDGKVARAAVQAGDKVKAGQLLIELEDQVGAAEIALRKMQSESEVNLKAAQAELELSTLEASNTEEMHRKGAATLFDLQRARLRKTASLLAVQQAEERRKEAAEMLRQAQARHDLYVMHAPIDGAVDEVVVRNGESVEKLRPVVRLLVTDPLWVDAAVPTEHTLKVKVGDSAWVRHKLPGYEDKPIEGKIIHMSQAADPASNTRLVRVEVPNPKGLPTGTQVIVQLTRSAQPTAAASKTTNTGE